ncbi:hypothetical protein L1887_09042 [Cichorium endivia]|nr:hypothetical protein L1887_09042 [Cichorium endivia]
MVKNRRGVAEVDVRREEGVAKVEESERMKGVGDGDNGLWRLSNSMFLGSTRVNLYLFMTHTPYPLTKTPSPYKYVIPTASSLQTILSFPKIYNSIIS